MSREGLEAGSRFDEHYVIEAVAGRGGMGVVYRAQDEELERRVALKVAAEAIADLPEFRAGLLREARLAARVDHPAVVGVHHVGVVDGRPYVALQWVEGSDLRSRLIAGPLGVDEALTIVEQLAGALDAAHAAGCLHRDVKPANVLVSEAPAGLRVALTDFGVAGALADAGNAAAPADLVGTPAYLAPELAHGQPGDERSDLYGLACVAFETLTGTPPFTAATVPAMLVAHAVRPRPLVSDRRDDLPLAVDDVLVRAMAIDPAARYASGTELSAALHHALDRGPGGAPARSVGARVRRARRAIAARPALRRTAIGVAALGLAGAGLGGAALADSLQGPGPVNVDGPRLADGHQLTLPMPGAEPFPRPVDAGSRQDVATLFAQYLDSNRRESADDVKGTLGVLDAQLPGRDGSCRADDDSVPAGFDLAGIQSGRIKNATRYLHFYMWRTNTAPVSMQGLSASRITQKPGTSLLQFRGIAQDADGRKRDLRLSAARFGDTGRWELIYLDFCPDLPAGG